MTFVFPKIYNLSGWRQQCVPHWGTTFCLKDFKVQKGRSHGGPWEDVFAGSAEVTPPHTYTAGSSFEWPETAARYWKLVMLSNHGNRAYGGGVALQNMEFQGREGDEDEDEDEDEGEGDDEGDDEDADDDDDDDEDEDPEGALEAPYPLDTAVFITSHFNQQLEDRDGVVGVHPDLGAFQEWTITDAGGGKVFIKSHQNQQLEDRDGVVGVHPDLGAFQEWTISRVADEDVK